MPVVFIRSRDLSVCVALGKTVFASSLRIMRAHRSRRVTHRACSFGSYTVDVWAGGTPADNILNFSRGMVGSARQPVPVSPRPPRAAHRRPPPRAPRVRYDAGVHLRPGLGPANSPSRGHFIHVWRSEFLNL